jgi:hypothetical protein
VKQALERACALNDAATCGTPMVGLTDADGAVVQALPTRQRVDFAGLVDLTELVTAAATVVA